MKWWQTALSIASNPVLAPLLAAIPGAGPMLPFIIDGVKVAQQLHGDTNNSAKRQLVMDGAAAASASGKVSIDPTTAVAVTNNVLNVIDAIHGIVKANQPTPATPPK